MCVDCAVHVCMKEAGKIKKEEDMQIDVNRILIADIN